MDFLAAVGDAWGQEGMVIDDSRGRGVLARLCGAISGGGGGGGGGSRGPPPLVDLEGGGAGNQNKRTTVVAESKEGLVPSSPFITNAVAPSENVPAAPRIIGSPQARVGPDVAGYSTPGPGSSLAGGGPTPPPMAPLVIDEGQLSAARARVAALEAQL